MVKVKTCLVCGAEFQCGITETNNTCWCTALPNIVPMPNAGDCLCPRCLKAKIDEMQATGAKVNQFYPVK